MRPRARHRPPRARPPARKRLARRTPRTAHAPSAARAQALFDHESGWRDEWLHPELRAALHSGDDAALRGLLEEVTEGVFRFPMLTAECCQMLIDEVDGYAGSGLPTSRPNSMNKYGLVLNEIGMEPMFDSSVPRGTPTRRPPPRATGATTHRRHVPPMPRATDAM